MSYRIVLRDYSVETVETLDDVRAVEANLDRAGIDSVVDLTTSAAVAKHAWSAAAAARTCEDGGADEVGLAYGGDYPTPAEVAEASTAPLDSPWLVALAAACQACPECEGRHQDDEDAHVVHRDGAVLVGCEGFHTALLRSLVLRARTAAVAR